jgi:hypothetical protein
MEGTLVELLRRQLPLGFPDLAGTRVSVRIPVSEALVNAAIAASLPPGGKVREVLVNPRANDRMRVKIVVAKPGFLPPITLTVAIDRQPALPESPDLVFRLEGAGTLLTFAGPALAFVHALPPGILMRGDQIFVNLKTLAESRGYGDWLRLVEHIHVSTEPGQLILSVDAGVPAAVPDPAGPRQDGGM